MSKYLAIVSLAGVAAMATVAVVSTSSKHDDECILKTELIAALAKNPIELMGMNMADMNEAELFVAGVRLDQHNTEKEARQRAGLEENYDIH